MTAPAAPRPETSEKAHQPTILVFSTNNISDPGIDLAGSSHLHYNPGVRVMPLPCTSLVKPAWILHAVESGFDGVFIASDGDECAYLSDCAERASLNLARAQELLKAAGHSALRVRMAAICSVCAEPFAKHVTQFTMALVDLGPSASEAPHGL
jgi:F420-non-reducing hydrogenase iron-sulfur subunit